MMHLPGAGPPAVRCIRQYPDAPARSTPSPHMELTLDQARTRLKDLYLARAVSFGTFTLASGKTSSYYINSKKVLFHGEAIALLGELLYQATCDLSVQAIGGLEVGAIPMAA